MPYTLAKRFFYLTAFTATVSAAYGADVYTEPGVDRCVTAAAAEGPDGRVGVQFTNHCDTCVAVLFETAGPAVSETANACYVPSETRVAYWAPGDYRIVSRKVCDDAEKNGFGSRVSAAALDANFRSGKCDLVGVFAD